MNNFLPINSSDLKKLNIKQLDIIIITGDAYIDHPSFGSTIIGRWLEYNGFKVGIIPRPQTIEDFKRLGKPKLFFAITAGNLDSMVCNYTASLKKRKTDAYSPGNKAGLRPDYATIKYSQQVRSIYRNIPIIIGGIEASLRRIAHYDYWKDKIRHSILLDAKADILIYGMGELAILELAQSFAKNKNYKNINGIGYVVTKKEDLPDNENYIHLLSYDELKKHPEKILELTKTFITEYNKNKGFIQKSENRWVVLNPPNPPLTTEQMDKIYSLPYQYLPHPSYKEPIKAWDMIKNSITISRGCPGGCTFCAITIHQGKTIQSRSIKNILKEVNIITKKNYFKGYINDLGGPTANLYDVQILDNNLCKKCNRLSCIYPTICKNLIIDYNKLLTLYKKIRKHPKIKKVFINSGIRYDIITNDKYIEDLVKYHISGQLKIAPEHVNPEVLKLMNKPTIDKFFKFIDKFKKINKKYNLKQYYIPYFILSFPGTTEKEYEELKRTFKKMKFTPEQIQIFTPTPMSLATAMYVSERSFINNKKINVIKNLHEKNKIKKKFQKPYKYDKKYLKK